MASGADMGRIMWRRAGRQARLRGGPAQSPPASAFGPGPPPNSGLRRSRCASSWRRVAWVTTRHELATGWNSHLFPQSAHSCTPPPALRSCCASCTAARRLRHPWRARAAAASLRERSLVCRSRACLCAGLCQCLGSRGGRRRASPRAWRRKRSAPRRGQETGTRRGAHGRRLQRSSSASWRRFAPSRRCRRETVRCRSTLGSAAASSTAVGQHLLPAACCVRALVAARGFLTSGCPMPPPHTRLRRADTRAPRNLASAGAFYAVSEELGRAADAVADLVSDLEAHNVRPMRAALRHPCVHPREDADRRQTHRAGAQASPTRACGMR